jgi:hypothetical protein
MSGVTMAGIAMGMGASMLMNSMQDSGGGASYAPTPPPATPAPTPMAATPMSRQKKTEQQAAITTAGAMTPQATLLSGNEKRSVLGG